jgi:hypothetical protein
MHRQLFLLLAATVLSVTAVRTLPAQSFDATALHVPKDLDARWLVHGGDDLAYARPDFDDSKWTLFDPHNSLTGLFPSHHPEVVWYRLRVKVDPAQTGLALRELYLSRAFEIYVNGERLIASGQVAPYVPYTLSARLLKRIPDRLLAGGSLLIALRVHIAPSEWTDSNAPGYYATNLTLGQESVLYRDDWLGVIGDNALHWADHLLMIGLGLVALVLFAAQRQNTEYLWIAAVGFIELLGSPEPVLAGFYNFPMYWNIVSSVPDLASPLVWTSLYFSIVHLRIGWRGRVLLAAIGLLNFFAGAQSSLLSVPVFIQILVNLPFIFLMAAVIPIVLAVHLWRGNREAGILLIPVLLFSLYIYAKIGLILIYEFTAGKAMAIHGIDLIDRFPAGPFSVSLQYVSEILSTIALALIMLRRSTTLIRRQTLLEGELAAAQQVQQLLVPEQETSIPGFAVESVYEPAQQVGGDFFQIVSSGDGGLLVVVGDVAGKGLPAAMLVSVLVGAIRGACEYTLDPAELLANLNDRLVGRVGNGFATALAARIDAQGAVIIANAGHLSPYLDGVEIDLPGAIPLGIEPNANYVTREFQLPPGGRLTFYSDGVIEAQNSSGELFGFERGGKISLQPAAAIVAAARRFGQQDDITVVSITRAAAIATAA